ncbi:MAG: hypothetical protein Q4F29_10520, partial [Lachnospiraceae bacterium]|nr:hypothetical protein [Lachnospiraceae bacterium]
MKYLQIKRIQIGLTAAVMILAGVCYSCSRFGDGKGAAADGGGSGVVVLSSEPGEAAEKPDLE